MRIERRKCSGEGRDEDRDIVPVEDPGQDPAIAAIVAGAGGDEHAAPQRGGSASASTACTGAPRRVHQGLDGDATGEGALIPAGGLGGCEDRNQHVQIVLSPQSSNSGAYL